MAKSFDAPDGADNLESRDADGIDRRGFLKCMAWAGAGVLWTVSGGVLQSMTFAEAARAEGGPPKGDFHFAQISDSHMGFGKEANKDVVGTFQKALSKIHAAKAAPAFVLHTGDISHNGERKEFDAVTQLLNEAKLNRVHYVPGEHDFQDAEKKNYAALYGKGTRGDGWYSFTERGVHFVALVNVAKTSEGGLGVLGNEQLEWLEDDVKGLSASTPVVLFAHIPLWSVYPDWGWGTADSERALSYLKRFGSVTVLNGHIHQVMQKVEGNVMFHTAMSTAFPQPAPGKNALPGPEKVPAGRLTSVLGVTNVTYVEGKSPLAVVDSTLA